MTSNLNNNNTDDIESDSTENNMINQIEIQGRFKFVKRIILKLCRFFLDPIYQHITDLHKELQDLHKELQDLQIDHKFLLEQNDYLTKNK